MFGRVALLSSLMPLTVDPIVSVATLLRSEAAVGTLKASWELSRLSLGCQLLVRAGFYRVVLDLDGSGSTC